jgi:hypothetical protein
VLLPAPQTFSTLLLFFVWRAFPFGAVYPPQAVTALGSWGGGRGGGGFCVVLFALVSVGAAVCSAPPVRQLSVPHRGRS